MKTEQEVRELLKELKDTRSENIRMVKDHLSVPKDEQDTEIIRSLRLDNTALDNQIQALLEVLDD